MSWAAIVFRGDYLSIPRSGNFQVFGKSRSGKIFASLDLVLTTMQNVFSGAPALDGGSQVQIGTIQPYNLTSTAPELPVLSINPTISPQALALVPDGFTNSAPNINTATDVEVITGSLNPLQGLINTPGTISIAGIQSLPYPQLGSPNRPAYIAEFNGLLTDAAHGARVLLSNGSLLGMLYFTEVLPGMVTKVRIFPAHLL